MTQAAMADIQEKLDMQDCVILKSSVIQPNRVYTVLPADVKIQDNIQSKDLDIQIDRFANLIKNHLDKSFDEETIDVHDSYMQIIEKLRGVDKGLTILELTDFN